MGERQLSDQGATGRKEATPPNWLSSTSHATAGTATSVRRSSTPGGATRLLTTMKKDLGIDRLPRHMECFDNSNIQGTNPVAACVVFKNGKPAKSEYRKFHVESSEAV